MRRDEGQSVKEIARTLAVSTSSVSRWVSDIALKPDLEAALRAHDRGRRLEAGLVRRERALARRASWQQEGRVLARRGNPLHMAGCMLYWAEGSRSRNSVYFTNSDPAMIALFRRFLVDSLGVPRESIRIDLNLFADHRQDHDRIERFWLQAADLPQSCLRASTVNVYSRHSARKRLNRLPHGTCRLSVHSTRLVQSIFGAIQEYGRFERPEWLG